MNEATRWRFALAERIGASYARNANAQVVMVAGSVGRGCADRYSDIELDVYYARPPTEAERIAAVESCGGSVAELAEDADEWEEQMLIGGFHAHSSTFLVSTMERYLTEVVDECAIAPEAQTIAQMQFRPADLSARLRRAFRIEPLLAVQELKALIVETLTLVETHVPELDTAPYRANLGKRRPAWDAPPPALARTLSA